MADAKLNECHLCKEREYGTGPVPGCGNLDAEVCLLGRNPGWVEDKQKIPFMGKAGSKLNFGLALAELNRELCRVDNVAKCVTPMNVTPSQQCQRICSNTWLLPTLRAMKKLRLIITLGNEALHVFERLGTVGDLHGTLIPPGNKELWLPDLEIFVSYHPSAALRSILMNQHFLADFRKLREYVTQRQLVGWKGGLCKA